MNSGKNAHQTIHNLYVDVIGGQQLKWPPFNPRPQEESKNASSQASASVEEQKDPPMTPSTAEKELWTYEMGFSLIIQAMIDAKKPVIGHNCMYDWIYLYNQFIGPLPETYLQFAQEWNSRFPLTFDTKVLAQNSKAFYQTALG